MEKNIEQIAITTSNIAGLKGVLKAVFGIDEWAEDTVKAKGTVFGTPCNNKARLHFNYQLGVELELLQYIDGENWLQARTGNVASTPRISHMGYQVSKQEMTVAKEHMNALGVAIAQEVVTYSHTNPETKGRRYHYVVFDTIYLFGFDLKLIERIEATIS